MTENIRKKGQTAALPGTTVRPIIREEKALSEFLSNFKVGKGLEYTHTSLIGGSYYISPDDIDTFFNLYSEAYKKNVNLFISEKHRELGPIVIDLDFKQTSDQRLYAKDDLLSIATTFQEVLNNSVEGDNTCYVLEKPQPRKAGRNYKDGIHLIFPYIVTNANFQYWLRREMLPKLDALLKSVQFLNKINDIYDEAVIERNNWLLYGSKKKDDTSPWEVSMIIKEGKYQPIDNHKSDTSLIQLFSIRNKFDESLIKIDIPKKPIKKTISTEPEDDEISVDEISFDTLSKMVMSLSAERSYRREPWISVLWCVFNISKQNKYLAKGYELIHRFSKQWECYNEDDVTLEICNATKYKGKKKGLGTLKGYLYEDNRQVYKELFAPSAGDDSKSVGTSSSYKETAFEYLSNILRDIGGRERLRRHEGYIWRPIEHVSCAYERAEDFQKFINKSLKKEPQYRECSRRFNEMIEYLRNRDDDQFPLEFVRDLDYISFSNGILNLTTMDFIEYSSENSSKYKNIIARHHIYQEFVYSEESPVFDSILKYQFSDDIIKMMYFSIGRMFFKLKQYDQYEFIPFLYGEAGTGKSTIANIIMSLFNPNSIGAIGENFEKTFGLHPLSESEIVVYTDVSEHISKILDEQCFLKMISGDMLSVAQKNQTATSMKWKIPMLFCGNHMLDYKNEKGCVDRRLLIFNFKNKVHRKDKNVNLESTILKTELPAILFKSLKTYHELRHQHGGASIEVWRPQEFDETMNILKMKKNYLYRFLTMDPEENSNSCQRFYVRYTPGKMLLCADLKKQFDKFMKFNHKDIKYQWDNESIAPILQDLGYELKQVNMCKSCGCEARSGCCQNYNNRYNRVKRYVVHNMELRIENRSSAIDYDDELDY